MIVLIDDDKLIHISWKIKARNLNQDLICFFSVEEFFQQSDVIAKSSMIYIDSDLGNNIKGEIISKEIFDRGYLDISLCTGYEDLDISDYSWIRRKVPKAPPF